MRGVGLPVPLYHLYPYSTGQERGGLIKILKKGGSRGVRT